MPSEAYLLAAAQLRSRLLKLTDAIWRRLTGYGDSDIERLVAQMVPRVMAGQVQIATLTAADIARRLDVKPTLVDRDAVTGGRGVSPETVYARPIITVRTELSRGETIVDALKRGGDRLQSLVSTDLQMAKVRQADASLQAAGIDGYRRVLSGNKNCALCVIASTQRYHVGDLMPIHPGCDCGVEEITSKKPFPELELDKLLEDAHGAVQRITGVSDRGGRDPDYRKLLLVREHGEIGNVLTWRGQKFTSLADLPKG